MKIIIEVKFLIDNTMNKKYKNHGFAKFVALLIIVAFIYITNSNQDTVIPDRPLSPDQKKELQRQKDKKAGRVRSAKNIPERVYENTMQNDKYANFLRSGKKIIYYAYLEDCSEANVFLDDLEKLMKMYPETMAYYFYYPDAQKRTTMVTCAKPGTTDCIQNFLFQNCSNNMCIINSQKKQILKISSSNYRQAFDKIYQYKNW